ncbi:MAG: hypothetical protein AAB796_00225 [Patescibacteria group bacterium]
MIITVFITLFILVAVNAIFVPIVAYPATLVILGIAIFIVVKKRKSKESIGEPMYIPEALKNIPQKSSSTLEKIALTEPKKSILETKPYMSQAPKNIMSEPKAVPPSYQQKPMMPIQEAPAKQKFEEPPHNLPVIAKQEVIPPPVKPIEPIAEKKPQSPVSFRFSFNDQTPVAQPKKSVAEEQKPKETLPTLKPFTTPEARSEPTVPAPKTVNEANLQKSLAPAEMKNALPAVIPQKTANEANLPKPTTLQANHTPEKEPAKPVIPVQPQAVKNTVELKQDSRQSEDRYREPIE